MQYVNIMARKWRKGGWIALLIIYSACLCLDAHDAEGLLALGRDGHVGKVNRVLL
jgi:hypothetical protein